MADYTYMRGGSTPGDQTDTEYFERGACLPSHQPTDDSRPMDCCMEDRITGPLLWRRYVKRSQTLQDQKDRAFLAAIDDARGLWNDAQPAFILSRPDVAPEQPSTGDILFPPSLAPMMEDIDEDIDQEITALAGASGSRPHDIRDSLGKSLERLDRKGHLALMAPYMWVGLLQSLCLQWWPPEFYPNWETEPYHHPAMLFVAACSIYEPITVIPERWFRAFRLRPRPNDLDPDAPQLHPQAAYWRARYQAMVDCLNELVDVPGADITPEMIVKRWQSHDARGIEDGQDNYEYSLRHRTEPRWVVPLLPGITTSDWQKAESTAVQRAAGLTSESKRRNFNDIPLHEHAYHLADQQLTRREIADLLGVSPSAISRILGKRPTTSAD